MTNQKRILFVVTVVVIVGLIYYFQSQSPAQVRDSELKNIVSLMNKEEKTKQYSPAQEISTPNGFINIDSITVEEHIGKSVILVDFWTYSCINCQRTFPYLSAWHEKYSDKGLVIIGVHTPEFKFEQDINNVRDAVERFGIKYPVVLDNDYSTWNAYKNRYWPRKYLIDIDGFIVYDHIGEGGYEETERKIQELLDERMAVLGMDEKIVKDISKPEDAEEVDVLNPRSPEIYFGALRNLYLGNGKSEKTGVQNFTEPEGIKTNILYLTGEWDFTDEFAENKNIKAKITFRYQGKNVFFVASAPEGVTARVFRDGKPLLDGSGKDVNNGIIKFSEDRLYELIRDSKYGEHTLEIIIDNPGLRAFAFTFG